MNQKVYVGNRATSFETYSQLGPITGVSLTVDENTQYFSGDETGYVVKTSCSYGTQRLADEMLQSMKGMTYKGYSAENAQIGPEAELGDGVTIKGFYSMLASRKLKFGPNNATDISAPGDNEVNHEYPYISETSTQLKKNASRISETTSALTRTASEIRQEVQNEVSGLASSFSVQVDSITERVENAEGDITTLETRAGSLEANMKTAQGDITSIKARAGALETSMQNAQGDITTLQSTASSLKTTVESHTGLISTAQQTADKINWLVKSSSTSETDFELTDRAVSLVSSQITLTATGNLGGQATIQLSSGSSATIDLSGVREAFANDDTAISIEAGTVAFNSNTFIVNSTNFKVQQDGTIEATNGKFSGKIVATSGTIGGLNIGENSLYLGATEIDSNIPGVYFGSDGFRVNTGSEEEGTRFEIGGHAILVSECSDSGTSGVWETLEIHSGGIQKQNIYAISGYSNLVDLSILESGESFRIVSVDIYGSQSLLYRATRAKNGESAKHEFFGDIYFNGNKIS